MAQKKKKMQLNIDIFVVFQLDSSLIVEASQEGVISWSKSCRQSSANTWSCDCTSAHLFAPVFASLRILRLSIRLSCCGWPFTASVHIRASAHTHTKKKPHVGVQTVAQRPRPPLAGPSAYALLITSPFIPNAMRLLSELQNNRVARNCTATEYASSYTSSATI